MHQWENKTLASTQAHRKVGLDDSLWPKLPRKFMCGGKIGQEKGTTSGQACRPGRLQKATALVCCQTGQYEIAA